MPEPTVAEYSSPNYDDMHREDVGRVQAWYESGRRTVCYYRSFCHDLGAWQVAVAWSELGLLVVASIELGVWANVVERGLADEVMPALACVA